MGGDSGLLAAGAEPERVATGAIWAEGPVWLPDRDVMLFSDVIGNKVFRYDPATGELGVHRDDVEYLNAARSTGTARSCSARTAGAPWNARSTAR